MGCARSFDQEPSVPRAGQAVRCQAVIVRRSYEFPKFVEVQRLDFDVGVKAKTKPAEHPQISRWIGPGRLIIPRPRSVRILSWRRWNCGIGVHTRCVGAARPRDPSPVVMPAIHNEVVDGSGRRARATCHQADLRLGPWLYKNT